MNNYKFFYFNKYKIKKLTIHHRKLLHLLSYHDADIT